MSHIREELRPEPFYRGHYESTTRVQQLWHDRERPDTLEHIDSVLQKVNPLTIQTQATVVKAFVLWRRGNLAEAFKISHDLLADLERQPIDVWYVRALNVRNCVWLELGEFTSAVDGLKEQLRLGQEINDLEMQASAIHDLGVLHFLSDALKAEPFLDKALELFEQAHLEMGQAYTCLNLAHVMTIKEEFAKAYELLKRAEVLTNQHDFDPVRPHLLAQKGQLALERGDCVGAQDLLTQALEHSLSMGRPLSEMMPALVRCYKQLNQSLELRDLLEHHLETVLEKGFRPSAVEAHELLSGLYEDLGDYKKALLHSREHIRLFQEVFTEKQDNKVRVFEVMYRTHIIEQKAQHIAEKNQSLQQVIDELESLNQEMLQTSQTDALTGLYNRRYLRAYVQEYLQKRTFCLALVDLDHFKRINDTYGHDKGDEVLKHFAQVLKSHVRHNDVVVRHGGEEFVIVFPEGSETEAKIVLERILAAMKEHDWQIDLSPTFTAGVGKCLDGDLDKVLKTADELLYFGKANGRNGVWTNTENT